MKRILPLLGLAALSTALPAQPRSVAPTMPRIETVARFYGPMPTGVTVSRHGRIFVNFPRWGDPVTYSVAEVRNGHTVAFPDNAWNHLDRQHPAQSLISVQSVVVDPRDRLWILDTGSIEFGPTSYGGPKMVCVDLNSNQVVKTILFPSDVALKTTYLNDVRFDLTRGKGGMAFITDSADKGPNGIIVVDLASGQSWRRLNDHPSTRAVRDFVPIVDGEPLMNRKPGQPPKPLTMGSDGIAISPDGKRLYYCPLAGRHLYSVSVDALADRARSDSDVASTVQDEGDKGGASDGLETDAQGNLYATDYEHHGIRRRTVGGTFEPFVMDRRIFWPDTLSVAANRYLYFTNNQLERQKNYHNGHDLRVKPYTLFRVRLDSGPVRLGQARGGTTGGSSQRRAVVQK